CELHISTRLGGLEDRLQNAFDRTLETWLLLGTLGLRATRAGGSFSWEDLTGNGVPRPKTPREWKDRCKVLLMDAPLKFFLIERPFDSAEEARTVVSNTIGGREDRGGAASLGQIRHPLGRIAGGRKTSPLRFRIIQ